MRFDKKTIHFHSQPEVGQETTSPKRSPNMLINKLFIFVIVKVMLFLIMSDLFTSNTASSSRIRKKYFDKIFYDFTAPVPIYLVEPSKYMGLEKETLGHDSLDADDLIREIAHELKGGHKRKKHKNKNLLHAINNKEKYYPFEIPYPPVKENNHMSHHNQQVTHIIDDNTFVVYPEQGQKAIINVNGAQYDLAPVPHPEYNPYDHPMPVTDYGMPNMYKDAQPREGKPQHRMMNNTQSVNTEFFKMTVNNGMTSFSNGMTMTNNNVNLPTMVYKPVTPMTQTGMTTDAPLKPIFIPNMKSPMKMLKNDMVLMNEMEEAEKMANKINTKDMLTRVMMIKEMEKKNKNIDNNQMNGNINNNQQINQQQISDKMLIINNNNNQMNPTNDMNMKQQMMMKMKSTTNFPPKASPSSTASSIDTQNKMLINLLTNHSLMNRRTLK